MGKKIEILPYMNLLAISTKFFIVILPHSAYNVAILLCSTKTGYVHI